ncbi:hypothetical protein PCE1_002433 [Barthelona sp. PCE]
MVFFFLIPYEDENTPRREYRVMMGRDKFENDELIAYGFEGLIWFHVDNYSSAHLYIVLDPEETMADVPQSIIQDVAQLTKDNSIEGRKKNSVNIHITPWENLVKHAHFNVGTVSFRRTNQVTDVMCTKDRDRLRVLNQLKSEDQTVDFEQLKNRRLRQIAHMKKQRRKEQLRREREAEQKREEERRERSYEGFFENDLDMTYSNENQTVSDYEDNFM